MIHIKKTSCKFTNKDKNTKLKLEAYNYRLDIYNIIIVVILGKDNLSKYCDLWHHKVESTALTCDYLADTQEVILFFKDNPNINSIVHECVHASSNILNHIGHEYDYNNDEVIAYLTAHLVDVVSKAYEMDNKGKTNGT